MCLQTMFILPKCGCLDPSISIPSSMSNEPICSSLDTLDCVQRERSEFDNKPISALCDVYCPLECNTQTFSTTISQSKYPSSYYSNILPKQSGLASKFNLSSKFTPSLLKSASIGSQVMGRVVTSGSGPTSKSSSSTTRTSTIATKTTTTSSSTETLPAESSTSFYQMGVKLTDSSTASSFFVKFQSTNASDDASATTAPNQIDNLLDTSATYLVNSLASSATSESMKSLSSEGDLTTTTASYLYSTETWVNRWSFVCEIFCCWYFLSVLCKNNFGKKKLKE